MLSSPGQFFIRFGKATTQGDSAFGVEYRRISLGTGQKKKQQLVRTRKSRVLSEPEWNEQFVVVIPKPSTSLTLVLWEKRSGKSKEKVASSVLLSWSDLTPWKAHSRDISLGKNFKLSVVLEYGPMQVMDTTPLTTKIPEARFAFERTVYYPGEVLQGVLNLHVERTRQIHGIQLSFDGFNYVDWYDDMGDTFFTGRDIYFSKQHMIMGTHPTTNTGRLGKIPPSSLISEEMYNIGISDSFAGGVELPAGEMQVPFQFVLPMNLPASMSHMNGCIGIFYFVEVRIFERGDREDSLTRQLLTIAPTKTELPPDSARSKVETTTTIIAKHQPLGDNYAHGFAPSSPLESIGSLQDTWSSSSSFSNLDYLEETHLKVSSPLTDVDLDGADTVWSDTKRSKKAPQSEPLPTRHLHTPLLHGLPGSLVDDGAGLDLDGSEESLLSEDALTPRSYDSDLGGLGPSPRRNRSLSQSSRSSRGTPISVNAILPMTAPIGKRLVFPVTIENRSNKPVTSLRIQLRSELTLYGHRHGKPYRRMHEYSCPKGLIVKKVEKDLPEFPVMPGTAWRGEVEILIPKWLYPSIQVKHLALGYEVKIEARTASRLLSGNLKSTQWNHISTAWKSPINLVTVTADADVALVEAPASPKGTSCDLTFGKPSDKLSYSLIPMPISPRGQVPATGYQFPAKTFA